MTIPAPCPLAALWGWANPAETGTVPSAFTLGAAVWSPRPLLSLWLRHRWPLRWAQSWATGCTSWTSEGESPAPRTPEPSLKRYTAPNACPQQAEGEAGACPLGLAPCRGTALTEREHLLPIQIAAVINSTLDLYFPDGCGVEIIARPGRYYVNSAFTFAASITAMEEGPTEQPGSDGRWDGGTVGWTHPCP